MGLLQVRPGAVDDAADIARVHVVSWRDTYMGLLPDEMLASLDVAVRRKMWASVLSDDDPRRAASVFVLEQADQIVGFAACGDQRSAELASEGFDGEVGAIYVLKQACGMGGGRLLMAASASALASHGYTGLGLWVLAENRAARAFYERLGGNLVGDRSELADQVVLTEVAYGWPELGCLTS